MSTYYSSEADMSLMGQSEEYGHLYPSTTGQSTPSIIYSPQLQQGQRTSAHHPGASAVYHQQAYRPVAHSPYQASSYWSSQQPVAAQSYTSYPAYQPGMSQSLSPEASLAHPALSDSRQSRPSYSTSPNVGLAANATSAIERSSPPLSRSMSPSSPDLRAYGYPNSNGTWSCNYPGCTSRAVFTRGCDLRKHHKRHTKSFFCQHEGCPQSTGGGFSSKKDLARHEAKHNPDVLCDWEGCDRVFSRVDNMRDHVKRIHMKSSRTGSRGEGSI